MTPPADHPTEPAAGAGPVGEASAPADTIRVAVLAAYPAVRAGLRALLEGAPGIEVAAELSPVALTAAGPPQRFDVLVADLGNDPEAIRAQIGATIAGMPAVLLAAEPAEHAGLRHRPGGYLLRHAGAEELAAAVRAVALGLVVHDPAVLAVTTQAGERAAPSSPKGGEEALTEREIEVLALLAMGLPNKGIAQRLGISEHTVKFHVGAILAKLGAAGRTEAVMLAARRGLVPL